MLARLHRIPYAIVRRMPFRAKLLMNHLVARHFLVGLIAIVINDKHEFLVSKHTYRGGLPYGLPSGWLKKGESPSLAMAREIREEAGLEVTFVRVLETQTRASPLRLDVWLLYKFAGGEFRSSAEVSEAQWVSLETAPPLLNEQKTFLAASWEELQTEGL